MVNRLASIHDSKHVCKGCILGKQSRRSFPKGKARRTTDKLEVGITVHWHLWSNEEWISLW